MFRDSACTRILEIACTRNLEFGFLVYRFDKGISIVKAIETRVVRLIDVIVVVVIDVAVAVVIDVVVDGLG